MLSSEVMMDRCFSLARIAGKNTKSNPMVGAVIVTGDRVIGEGYHKNYGGRHAEIEAFESVALADRHLIPGSTMYVSLEPCNHHGKTPPCSERIIEEGIKKVVIACEDPNPLVHLSGIQKMVDNGLEVETRMCNDKGKELISRFEKSLVKLPYVILKIVKSADGFIGSRDEQIWMSNKYVRMLTHKWRSEIDGILIGKHTAITDNASLTTRLWPGQNPIRILWDNNLEVSNKLNIYNSESKTIILNKIKNEHRGHIVFKDVSNMSLENVLSFLFQNGIYSLMVEGGSATINHFIERNLWDEARVISTKKQLKSENRTNLVKASEVKGRLITSKDWYGDMLEIIRNDDEDSHLSDKS